jgi:catechol 2,3-dioxygenase-like lactoylglutathione lyase family enzyme
MQLNHILETTLYVTDLETAREFYSTVLGLEMHSEAPHRHVFFRCGAGMLLIFDPRKTDQEDAAGVPAHGARGAGHVAWSVASDELGPWRERLRAAGVTVEKEVAWPQGAHSIYFRDPAGNSLELVTPELWEK